MEALVVILVPLIAFAIYLVSRTLTYGQPQTPEEHLAALKQQEAWHEQRLRHAREKNWDEGMVAQILAQLHDTRGQLARVSAAATPAAPRNPAP